MGKVGLVTLIGALFLAVSACGKNVYRSLEKEDVAEDSTIAMEKNNPDAAITMLRDALEDSPGDYTLISLLSAAIAQKFGIDAVTLALAMVENEQQKNDANDLGGSSQAGATGQSNEITSLFALLPAATKDNIAGVMEATSLLETIPVASRTMADNFKLAMLHTSLLALRTKQFDKDGDGIVSPVELLSLSDQDAMMILTSLISAQMAMNAGIDPDSTNSQVSTENLATIQQAINNQPGETTAEKLRNYLNSGTR